MFNLILLGILVIYLDMDSYMFQGFLNFYNPNLVIIRMSIYKSIMVMNLFVYWVPFMMVCLYIGFRL